MSKAATVDQIRDLLGSAHIFTTAVDELMSAQLRAAGVDPLTFSQIQVLQFIDRTSRQTIGTLARFLGVSNAAASKAVDRLVRRNLMERTESPRDRRVMYLTLTDEGRWMLARFRDARNRALAEIFGGYDAGDLRHAADLLDELSATIVRHERAEDESICFRCGIYFRERCLLQERDNRVCYFHRQRRDPRAGAVPERLPPKDGTGGLPGGGDD